jgi:hypothetical protein
MADIAILICSYAPLEEVFSRTLMAVRNLAIPPETLIECVIVDNNNVPALAARPYISEFLSAVPWARIVTESAQGLTHARLAGVAATGAPVLIFFDDDNEPAADYLLAAKQCLAQHRDVYVWGPGKTVASFDSTVSPAFRNHFGALFQEREFNSVEYGCVPARSEKYYPYGTGMVVRREVMTQYAMRVRGGELGRSGRSGQNLSSGDDTQIVWEAVRMGKAAGVAPDLKMTHVISRERTTLRYIARLLYGTGASYLPALIESFPGERARLAEMEIGNYQIVKSILRIFLKSVIRMRRDMLRVELARYLGPLVGLINVSANPEDRHWVRTLAARLNLE